MEPPDRLRCAARQHAAFGLDIDLRRFFSILRYLTPVEFPKLFKFSRGKSISFMQNFSSNKIAGMFSKENTNYFYIKC